MRTSTLRKLVAGCTFALGLAFVPSLQAQGGGGFGGQMGTPDERADRQITALTPVLALTADQTAKIKPILVKQYTEQAAAMAGAQGGDMAAFRAANQERTTKVQAEISALLTAEQKTKYTAYLAEQAARRGQGGQGGGAPRQQ
jgi:Spy/CpxP family protein refolding chaperone